jgi:uncharacterized protein (TIGR03382 family)
MQFISNMRNADNQRSGRDIPVHTRCADCGKVLPMLRRVLMVVLAVYAVLTWSTRPVCADIVTTTFASNNGQSGNMFNVNVLAAQGIDVEQLQLNLDPGSWNVQLYTLDSSYAGFETNAGAWTLRDSVTGLVSAGTNVPTTWNVSDFFLEAGIEAFYVRVANGTALNYTNGTSEGAFVAGDANLQIFQGTGNAGFFGTQFRPRIWNGSIIFTPVTIAAIPEVNGFTLTLAMLAGAGLLRRRK